AADGAGGGGLRLRARRGGAAGGGGAAVVAPRALPPADRLPAELHTWAGLVAAAGRPAGGRALDGGRPAANGEQRGPGRGVQERVDSRLPTPNSQLPMTNDQ